MHASHVAILVLAASAASPALSAPLAARGTAGVPATSDTVARGFPPGTFSNVNKGAKAIKRDGPVDDIQPRGFDPSLFSNVNKGTKAVRAPSPDAKDVSDSDPHGARAVPPAFEALDDFLAQHGKPNPGRRPGGIRARDLEDAFLQGIARRDHDVSDTDPHGARAVPPAFGALDDFLAQHGKPNPGRRPGGIRARDLEDAFLQGIARRDHDVSDSDSHGARASPFATLDDFLAEHGFPRPSPGRVPTGIRARDLEAAFLQAISRRNVSELEPRFGLGTLLKEIKTILGSKKIARRDVTPEQLIALVSLASLPLDSLD
ncbi:hypothetical protein EDB83DRAFT_1462026 [Lactarius deliciosus]|nr:hypothetical protein EDB83DRAFT_1462026 [Lactarius deliciosus]